MKTQLASLCSKDKIYFSSTFCTDNKQAQLAALYILESLIFAAVVGWIKEIWL